MASDSHFSDPAVFVDSKNLHISTVFQQIPYQYHAYFYVNNSLLKKSQSFFKMKIVLLYVLHIFKTKESSKSVQCPRNLKQKRFDVSETNLILEEAAWGMGGRKTPSVKIRDKATTVSSTE